MCLHAAADLVRTKKLYYLLTTLLLRYQCLELHVGKKINNFIYFFGSSR